MGGSVIAYELTADDLLSEATDRYVAKHPLFTRLVILAIAGHLSGMMPTSCDVFSANNVVHRWAVRHYPLARTERVANKAKKVARG